MLPGPPRRRRARPVADAPIEALLSRSEDLAKGWLLALLERAPLDDAPRILAAGLSRDGPRMCDAIVRAIADDAGQARLEPGGALVELAERIGELTGASGAEATSHAVDALRAVVWVALRSELRDPEPDLISELAERLAQVTELVRASALRRADQDAAAATRSDRPGGLSFAARRGSEPDLAPPPPVAGRRPEVAPPRTSEERPVSRFWVSEPPTSEPPTSEPPTSEPPTREPPRAAPAWIGNEPPAEALWVRGLEEEIQRTGHAPLALLLAELEDADRVRAVEADPARVLGEFTRAVRGVVRHQDILVTETETRAWIIATNTGRIGAKALGQRIAAAVSEGPPWRGGPLRAAIGLAVLGEDGQTSGELIDAAEEARFAASASGVDLVGAGPGDVPPER